MQDFVECTHAQLEDGAIRVTCGTAVGTVSSWHLVPTKENQLRQALGIKSPRLKPGAEVSGVIGCPLIATCLS